MSTVRYGDVVTSDKTIKGEDLEKKLRIRREAEESLQDPEATEDQQTDNNNNQNESK